jgi:hypothetical protein
MRLPPRQSTAEADLMIPFQLVSDAFPLYLEVLMISILCSFTVMLFSSTYRIASVVSYVL